MNLEEISKRYQVPLPCLQVFEQAGLLHQEQDINEVSYISHLLTLWKLGMNQQEISFYVTLEKQGQATLSERKRLLQEKRNQLLTSIHKKEQSIQCLDYIYFELCHE